MSSPKQTHSTETEALETVKKIHKGYTRLSAKLLIAHVVSDTIKILDKGKSATTKTEVKRIKTAISGMDLTRERRRVLGEISDVAKDIGIQDEATIKGRIKNIELSNTDLISASSDLIVQLESLKRGFRAHKSKKKTPPAPVTPPPAPTHTPPTNPNILGTHNISITTLPHSEKIQGGINAGETLWMTKDRVHWLSVPVDTSNNFSVPISETANGSYTYRFKTKNAAGVESGEETVIVDINVVAPVAAPNVPNIPKTSITIDTLPHSEKITGDVNPGDTVEWSKDGGSHWQLGTVNATGNFNINISEVRDGTYVYQVRAKKGGNLSAVIDVTVEITAFEKVEQEVQKAESAPLSQAKHDSALTQVNTLPNSTEKNELLRRLRDVQNSIHHPRLSVTQLQSVTPKSLEIEQDADAQLELERLQDGTTITILNSRNQQISDPLDVSGISTTTMDLVGIDTSISNKVYDIQIVVQDTHNPSNPPQTIRKKIKIVPKKIDIASSTPKISLGNRFTGNGKIKNGERLNLTLQNIPEGASIRIKEPTSRMPGGPEEITYWGGSKTEFRGNIENFDTTNPTSAPEELVVEIFDKHNPGTPPKELKLNFQIDEEEADITQSSITSPTDKIKNGDPIIFGVLNINPNTEIVVQPGGASYDMSSVSDISITGVTRPGKHTYNLYIRDKNHRYKKLAHLGKFEVEVDYPELTLTTPVVPVAPILAEQGMGKPNLPLSNLTIGSEITISGPGGELIKHTVRSATETFRLDKLDTSVLGVHPLTIQVRDPKHDSIPQVTTIAQVDVKKKVEAPKHLPQPVFKTPVDYAEGGGDIEVELLNAVTHSEVTVEYSTAGGRTTSSPLTVTADGNLKLPLAGFDAPTGTTNITVNYRNPLSGAVQSRTITMHVAPRPTIERPEGLQDETDINTKPFDVKIGKIKPGQTISITGNTSMSDGTTTTPNLRNSGGTYMLNIPAGAESVKQNYTVTITDTTGATESFPIVVNVKVPPKANMRIDHHNFIHGCEEAKKHGVGHYRINGEAHHFDVTKSWGKYKTNIHGEEFKAKTPELLYKAVKEHLDHHNQHEKDEYNAYWGLMPESSDHKKDGEHGKDHGEKDGKKDKEGGHEKGGHGDHGSESKGGGFTGALKTVATAPFKALWKQPAWLLGAEVGLGWSLASGGAVLLGPAVIGCAGLGAAGWALKKLWQIKNGKKGDEGGGHGGH